MFGIYCDCGLTLADMSLNRIGLYPSFKISVSVWLAPLSLPRPAFVPLVFKATTSCPLWQRAPSCIMKAGDCFLLACVAKIGFMATRQGIFCQAIDQRYQAKKKSFFKMKERLSQSQSYSISLQAVSQPSLLAPVSTIES